MRVTVARMRIMGMAIVAVAFFAGVGVAFAQAGDPNAAADPATVKTGPPQAPVENAEEAEAAEEMEAETETEAAAETKAEQGPTSRNSSAASSCCRKRLNACGVAKRIGK